MPRNHRSTDQSAPVLGRVLRETREAAGKSQQETALRADMDRAYLSEVENGKRTLSVDRLLRICSALNVKAAEVISAVEKLLPKQRAIENHNAMPGRTGAKPLAVKRQSTRLP